MNLRLNFTDLQQRIRLSNTDHLELFMGWLALIWGAWVMLPPSTFDSAPGVYSTMRWLCASELVWGVFIATVGLAVWIVWVAGTVRWRARMSFVLAMIWLLLASMFGIGDARSAGIVIYGSFALASAVVHLRLARRGV